MESIVAVGIKTTIAQKGLRQKYVAEKAGFTEQQLSDMLNGRKLILADYIQRFSDAMGVSIQDIYDAGRKEEVS